MKFCTLAVAAFTLLVPEVNSQTVTNGNFQFVESYNFKYGLGREYLGGGSIVGNTLYLVVRAEKADSYIASVPVERDADTGRIIGFDFPNLTEIYHEEYLEQLSQRAQFPDSANPQTPRYYVFTNTDDDNYPFSIGFASSDPAFSSIISRIENIPALNLFDNGGTGDQFLGCYGVDFSPVITDPETGIGKLMCTSVESFWEVGLQLKTDGNAEWEISSVTKLADLAPEYAGGCAFIPSSSLKGNIFFADWDYDLVKMIEFGADGLPLGTVSAPQISNFITGIEDPWGFFFDPITNDFFVSTWGKSGEYDGIVQFKGFAPGLDIDVVTENIQNEMKLVLQILFNASNRRKLGRDASAQVQLKLKYLRGRRNLENKGQGADHKADPCKKANLNAAHGLEMAGKNCNKETVIPPAEEIANEILTAEDADVATATFVSLLDETFTNESYLTNVLSGETPQTFIDNLEQITLSVDLIEDEVIESVGEEDKAEALACLTRVNYFLALLATVVEGN